MNDDILKETNDWIRQLVQWEKQKTIDVCSQQLQQLPAIKSYLEKLLDHHLLLNLDQPQICHLMMMMNKLSEMNALLTDQDFALTLVQCLLQLASPKVTTDAKSKSLALFQFSKAIRPNSVETEITEILECIGKSQQDFRQLYIKQALNSIKRQVVPLGNPCDRSVQGKQNTPEEIPLFSTDCLLALARLCLHLRQETEFSTLLEAVLENLVACRRSDPKVELLVKQVASVNLSPGKVGSLSYGCLVIIWSSYLQILEEEVLNIIHFVTEMTEISKESLLQFSANLVKACCEYTEINVAVFSILRQVYIQSQGHYAVGRVIAILSTAIWQHLSCTEIESHVRSYPVCYRYLIKSLRINPFGMKMSTSMVHLRQLMSIIDDVISADTLETTVGDVCWLLTQFSLWYQTAVIICFRGDEQVTVSCVRLICWCSGLYYVNETLLRKLQEVAASLKALVAKSTLTIHDINFVLASSNLRLDDVTDERLKMVVRKLLLTFCFQFNSIAPMIEQIVTLAFGIENQHVSLLHVANILEFVMENPGSWVNEICIRKSDVICYMQHVHKILSAQTSQVSCWLPSKTIELLSSNSAC